MNKAKKVHTIYGKYANEVEYEYRGKHYFVEYANDWTYCVTPPRIQHEDAQERIDKEIAMEESDAKREHRYEDTAEYGFNVFWDYVNSKAEDESIITETDNGGKMA